MRRFLSSGQGSGQLLNTSPLVEYTHAPRTVRSASRRWASQTQHRHELQSCPCDCVNGALHPTILHFLTEATRSSSQFGTLRLHFRPNSKQRRPNLKAPASRNGNAALTCSPESYGEQKMCVYTVALNSTSHHACLPPRLRTGCERLVEPTTARA